MSNRLHKRKWSHWITVSKLLTFSESFEPLSRNRDPNMTQNLHVCTICFRPEVVYGVISGRKVKTVEGYPVVRFEVASSNSFRNIKTRRPTNWWGSGKREDTHPKATVLYNASDHFLRKRSCITRLAWVNWPWQQHDTSYFYVMHRPSNRNQPST